MEQHEVSGSGAAESEGDQDPRRGNDRDDREMDSNTVDRDTYNPHEMHRLEREPREDSSSRERWKREETSVLADMEIGPMREDARKHIIEEYERKQRYAKAKAKAEEIRLIERLEREKREAKEEEMRFIEKIKREKREAKEEEKRVIEKVEREKREKHEAANTPQQTSSDGPGSARAERQPTVADLYLHSLQQGVEKKGGIWPSSYNATTGPTKAHRVCQWSVWGHDGIGERARPMYKEPLKELTAELQRTVTGDRVFLIENIRHPQSHIGDLGCLLGLPVEVFHGLADFERWQVHIKSELPARLLIDIDDGIERVFRKAKALSSEDNRAKAMIRRLGNSMTAARDLLWFLNLHPEGTQRSHMIMNTLIEVIPNILESFPLLGNPARSADLQADAMFLEALAAQLEGQLEECRLHWLFCMRGLAFASDALEWDGHDAKILCIRANKNICLIIVDEIPRTSERPRQHGGLPRVRDDVKSEHDALEFSDPSLGKKIIIPQVNHGMETSTYLTLQSFLRQGWPIDILCGEEQFVTQHSKVGSSTLMQPPSDFTAIDPRAFLYLLASWSWSERLDKLDKAAKQLSFNEIRNTKSAQQFYKLNDDLHSYRKSLNTLKEHVADLSKNLPLYLEGYLDDFLVTRQRYTASLPDQLKLMLERTKDLDKFLIDSFQILTSSVSVYESDQSSRQNELSILITVLAFIYVPLTLVTGIFGMNIVQAPNGFVWWSPLVALLVVVAFTFLITILALEGVKVWRRHRVRGTGRSGRSASGSNDDEARIGKVSVWERATGLMAWRRRKDNLV